ncbi:MAG: hypothetical protein KGH85_07035 [Thaumarchaeota archaeon]|nr:hypothetical protein [Nitrososphaerota archaeon]
MVDMMPDSHTAVLKVKTQKKGTITLPLKKGQWGEDPYKRVHDGVFSFNETDKLGFEDIEKGDELSLTVTDKDGHTRIFYYFVEKVTLDFEKDPTTGKTIFSEITINGISHASILSRNIIEGTFEFEGGYGDIAKQFGEKYGFDTSGVKLIKKKGMIFFKQMPILEAIRRMALIENWCFYFRDKMMIFEPCHPPLDSGVVLTEDQIIKGIYTKS